MESSRGASCDCEGISSISLSTTAVEDQQKQPRPGHSEAQEANGSLYLQIYFLAAAHTLTMREGNDSRTSQSASVVERYRQHCVESHLSLIFMAYAETKQRNLSDIDVIRYMKETAVARRTEQSAHNESHPFAYNKLATCKRTSEPSAPVEDDLF